MTVYYKRTHDHLYENNLVYMLHLEHQLDGNAAMMMMMMTMLIVILIIV